MKTAQVTEASVFEIANLATSAVSLLRKLRTRVKFANEIESQIDKERKALKKIARTRLESGANVKAELLYIDLVRQIEKIGDRCFSIAEQLSLTK